MKSIPAILSLFLSLYLVPAHAGTPAPPVGTLMVSPWGNPAVINFPSQLVGTSSPPQNTTLTAQLFPNVAGYEVRIDAISVSPAGDFAKGAGCDSGTGLANGGSCAFPTTFTPAAEGPRSAMINVTCSVVSLATIVSIVCNGIPQSAITLNGTGFVLSQISSLSQTGVTLLALVLMGLALHRLRRTSLPVSDSGRRGD